MDWNRVEGNWKQVKGKVKEKWGKLTDDDRQYIEGAFRLLQNRFLNGPISALKEESHAQPEAASGHTLLDALRKLFRLRD